MHEWVPANNLTRSIFPSTAFMPCQRHEEHFNFNISCPVSNISLAVKSPPTHPTEQYVVENVSFFPLLDQEGRYLHSDHPAYFFPSKEGNFLPLLSCHNRRKYRYPLLLGKSGGEGFLSPVEVGGGGGGTNFFTSLSLIFFSSIG